MRRDDMAKDLGKVWTLSPADLALVAGLPDAGRLSPAAQLAHWRAHGRFPNDEADLPPDKGHDLRLIQDYLGHRDPRHAVHYTRTAGPAV